MFRRLVLAGVVAAVVAGVGLTVQPAAATPQEVENRTTFETRFVSDGIPPGGNGTAVYVAGVPVGTPIEITATGLSSPTLERMLDSNPTDATPSNRTAAGNAHRPAGTDPFGTTAVTTDDSGPGFGPVFAALSLAVLGVLAARRTSD